MNGNYPNHTWNNVSAAGPASRQNRDANHQPQAPGGLQSGRRTILTVSPFPQMNTFPGQNHGNGMPQQQICRQSAAAMLHPNIYWMSPNSMPMLSQPPQLPPTLSMLSTGFQSTHLNRGTNPGTILLQPPLPMMHYPMRHQMQLRQSATAGYYPQSNFTNTTHGDTSILNRHMQFPHWQVPPPRLLYSGGGTADFWSGSTALNHFSFNFRVMDRCHNNPGFRTGGDVCSFDLRFREQRQSDIDHASANIYACGDSINSSASKFTPRGTGQVAFDIERSRKEVLYKVLLSLRDLCREDAEKDKEDMHDTDGWHYFRVPQVNHFWRDVFTDNRDLFSVIDLSFWEDHPSPSISDESERQLQENKHSIWIRGISDYVSYTGDKPLALCFSPGCGPKRHATANLYDLINSLLKQIPDRIRELQIWSNPGANYLDRLVQPAPKLEVLILKSRPTEDADCHSFLYTDYLHEDVIDIPTVILSTPDLLGRTAPNLHTAIFLGCSVPWTSPILRNGLRYFSVQYPNLSKLKRTRRTEVVQPFRYLAPPKDLFDILRSASDHMKYLNLLHALPVFHSLDFSGITPISLRQLRSFQLADRCINCVGFLQPLDIPPSSAVTIHCYGCGSDEHYHLATYLASLCGRNRDITIQVDVSNMRSGAWLRTTTRDGDAEIDFRPHVEWQTTYLLSHSSRLATLRIFFNELVRHGNPVRRLFLVDSPVVRSEGSRIDYFDVSVLSLEYDHPCMDLVTDVIYEGGRPDVFLGFLCQERLRIAPSGLQEARPFLPNLQTIIFRLRIHVKLDKRGLVSRKIVSAIKHRQNCRAPLKKILLKNCQWIEQEPDVGWVRSLAGSLEKIRWHVEWDGSSVSPVLGLAADGETEEQVTL
ncbi:hypothetical protein EVG20_g6004 [Dentipellis fragilis]|uniref:Uncharacterized protein n=1 Tax=Dentipellis fragilis TaxID=205917 RepID=A0A4Y9YP89_9AGAM|nr:hypothetical protein EVG20_g6004 [Dentipellis fragilis]